MISKCFGMVAGAFFDDVLGERSGSAYVFAPAPVVPLPAGVWLLCSAFALMGLQRRIGAV